MFLTKYSLIKYFLFSSFLLVFESCNHELIDSDYDVTTIEVANMRDEMIVSKSTINVAYTNNHQIKNYEEHFLRFFDGNNTLERHFNYTFNYSNERCDVMRVIDDDDAYMDTYYLNNDGTIKEARLSNGSTISYSYNKGYLSAIDGNTYYWNNDNIVSIIDNLGRRFELYYYDLPNPFHNAVDWAIDVGKLLPGEPFGYGFLGPRNANLIQDVIGDGISYHWYYEIDESGRIIAYKRVFVSEDNSSDVVDVKLVYQDTK